MEETYTPLRRRTERLFTAGLLALEILAFSYAGYVAKRAIDHPCNEQPHAGALYSGMRPADALLRRE